METVTKITAEEAKKMYYESQKLMSKAIKKGRKLTFYNGILAAVIIWGMLLMPSATAYAKSSDQSTLDLLTKGYRLKPKGHNSKSLQQFPKDVVNLATAWREIPRTAYHVGQEDGVMMGIAAPTFLNSNVVGTALSFSELDKVGAVLSSTNIRKDSAVGPIKGTTSMAKNISKGVWQSLNSDKDQSELKGLIFNYKF